MREEAKTKEEEHVIGTDAGVVGCFHELPKCNLQEKGEADKAYDHSCDDDKWSPLVPFCDTDSKHYGEDRQDAGKKDCEKSCCVEGEDKGEHAKYHTLFPMNSCSRSYSIKILLAYRCSFAKEEAGWAGGAGRFIYSKLRCISFRIRQS